MITLEYYSRKDILLEQILHTIDIVYRPDIIFLDFQSNKIYDASKEEDIDMCISCNCKTYKVKSEGMLEIVRKPEEIFNII